MTWTKKQDREIQRKYAGLGPIKLAKEMGVTLSSLYWRARMLVVRTHRGIVWTLEMTEALRSRYLVDGAAKLAKEFGTTPDTVRLKASRMGFARKVHAPYHWTGKMLSTINRLYTTSDRETLVREIGVPYHVIQSKARSLGLLNLVRTKLSGKTLSNNNTSCDIHFFDEWSDSMAYILGFMFADGSVNKRQTDMIVGLAEKDECVLRYMKAKTKSTRELYVRESKPNKDGCTRQRAVFFILGSKILVARLMELGLRPRKTYNDNPFPEVPDDMMPHFVRGYLDGDGTIFVSNNGTCHVGFIGSPKFIIGIRDALVRLAGMRSSKVNMEHTKSETTCGRVGWSALQDLRAFHDFAYPPGYEFCLERKRAKLAGWLEHKTDFLPPEKEK